MIWLLSKAVSVEFTKYMIAQRTRAIIFPFSIHTHNFPNIFVAYFLPPHFDICCMAIFLFRSFKGELENSMLYTCHHGRNRVAYRVYTAIPTHPGFRDIRIWNVMDDSK